MHPSREPCRAIAASQGVGRYMRHVLLCVGPDCCTAEQGNESWEYLKRRLKELNLAGAGGVYRTKVGCLKICQGGPTGVVYPDGSWYCGLTPENIEWVLQQHLLGGKPVEELIIGCNPLLLAKGGPSWDADDEGRRSSGGARAVNSEAPSGA